MIFPVPADLPRLLWGVGEGQRIGGDEARRAEQVKRLIDPAVVIVAVVIPLLQPERLNKAVHRAPLRFMTS